MLNSYLSQANFDMGSASLFFCLDASHSTAEPCRHSWNSSEQSCPRTTNSMNTAEQGFQLPVGSATWLQSPDWKKKFMTSPGSRNIIPLLTPATCFHNFFSPGFISPVSLTGALFLAPPFGGLTHGGFTAKSTLYLQKAQISFSIKLSAPLQCLHF